MQNIDELASGPDEEGSLEGVTGVWGSSSASYEYYICIFMLFYGSFWYILKLHTDDEQDL
jgi:hypothetical protein